MLGALSAGDRKRGQASYHDPGLPGQLVLGYCDMEPGQDGAERHLELHPRQLGAQAVAGPVAEGDV